MADGVRTAVAGAALAQAGAVWPRRTRHCLATTTAADVTGIIAAGAIAVLGMFVIPSKRAQAKAQLREAHRRMRTELMTDLRAQFEREVDRSVLAVGRGRALHALRARRARETVNALARHRRDFRCARTPAQRRRAS